MYRVHGIRIHGGWSKRMDRVHIENREQETAYSEPCTDKHTFSVETSPRIQRLRVCESLDYGLHTVPNGNAP